MSETKIPRSMDLWRAAQDAYKRARVHGQGIDAIIETVLDYAESYYNRLHRSNPKEKVRIQITPLQEGDMQEVHLRKGISTHVVFGTRHYSVWLVEDDA